jgi:hypothetical protein
MLSKESKISVLEKFYGIDYALFGKPVSKINNCCPIMKEEYIQIKGALLSVFVEMLKLIDHQPKKLSEKIDSAGLRKMARETAKLARVASAKIVKTEKARVDIKNDVRSYLKENKDADVSKLVENKIREKAYRLAIDNLIIAKTLHEAKNLEVFEDWTGKIIEDSYKILRDNLCETAMLIMDNE